MNGFLRHGLNLSSRSDFFINTELIFVVFLFKSLHLLEVFTFKSTQAMLSPPVNSFLKSTHCTFCQIIGKPLDVALQENDPKQNLKFKNIKLMRHVLGEKKDLCEFNAYPQIETELQFCLFTRRFEHDHICRLHT